MKLKVFQGFYLLVLLFVTTKPFCAVVKQCVYPSPEYCMTASTAPLVFLVGCAASAGCSFMSRVWGFYGFFFFFSPTKWSSALSFAVSCMLGCSSHWKVNALLHSACEEWLLSAAAPLQGLYWALLLQHWAVSILVRTEVWKKSLRRMWHFDKRINSGALPHCTAEMFEFTNVSLLYLKH